MAKTTFGPGVIVTSKWLNGAQQIHFDGLDLDWHYPPLTIHDVQLGGENGFDGRYVTLGTDQVYGGDPIIGSKSAMGLWEFGDALYAEAWAAPKSWATNVKFDGTSELRPFNDKWASLRQEDIITKKQVDQLVFADNGGNFPNIDEGYYGA